MNAPETDNDLDEETPFFLAIGVATCTALFAAARFAHYLPITDGWTRLERLWFPLAALNTAFHEAGHVVFGLLQIEWVAILGGTLMQLLLPAACLVHFLRQHRLFGVAFTLFWIGTNLAQIAWYAADAKAQVLILITGLSGSEGGGHDWGYLLGALGLLNVAVGVGRLFFFAAVWSLVFAPAWALAMLWLKWKEKPS